MTKNYNMNDTTIDASLVRSASMDSFDGLSLDDASLGSQSSRDAFLSLCETKTNHVVMIDLVSDDDADDEYMVGGGNNDNDSVQMLGEITMVSNKNDGDHFEVSPSLFSPSLELLQKDNKNSRSPLLAARTPEYVDMEDPASLLMMEDLVDFDVPAFDGHEGSIDFDSSFDDEGCSKEEVSFRPVVAAKSSLALACQREKQYARVQQEQQEQRSPRRQRAQQQIRQQPTATAKTSPGDEAVSRMLAYLHYTERDRQLVQQAHAIVQDCHEQHHIGKKRKYRNLSGAIFEHLIALLGGPRFNEVYKNAMTFCPPPPPTTTRSYLVFQDGSYGILQNGVVYKCPPGTPVPFVRPIAGQVSPSTMNANAW